MGRMNRWIVFAALLLAASPALAVGTLIVTTFTTWVGTTALVAAAAINFAVSLVVTRIFGAKPPKMGDNGLRQQIPPATINSLPVVYGDAYLGAAFVDAVLSPDQKVMYYVLAISSISDNGQFSYDTTKFYYGDRVITFDTTDRTKVVSLTDGYGNVDTKISGKLFINLYTSTTAGVISSANGASAPSVVMASGLPSTVTYKGAVDNYADLPTTGNTVNDGYIVNNPYSTGGMGGSQPGQSLQVWNGTQWRVTNWDKSKLPPTLAWPSSGRQMQGTAFAIVKLVYNTDAGTTSLSPITFKCSHYLNNQGCAKPGDVWLDYIQNVRYGGAMATAIVDAASATALNTYADQTITYTTSGGTTSTQPRYRINGVIDTSKPVLDNLDSILTAADSWMAYDAAKGQWSIIVNKADAVFMAFNDTNIIGDIRVSVQDINQSINQIEVKFPNKLNKDVPAYVFLQTPSYLLFPNEPVNKYSTTFDLVNDSVQAQYLANRLLEQAREDLIVTFKTAYPGIQCSAGDVISITNAAYGWNAKLFRVMKVSEVSLPDGNLGASFDASEYNAQVYDDKDITAFSPAPNSGIANVLYFGDLFAPTVTDQQPNAAVPSFAIECVLPGLGQISQVALYYTTVSSPAASDWNLWGYQTASNSTAFANDSTIKFPSIGLPTGTYYFAYTVGNSVGTSQLSPASSSYNWLPNPSSSSVAGTFIAQFSPPTLSVPYSGTTATFTGITPQLYGTTAGGSVDFVASQTDSDSLFVANTWRIGGSSTTGYADIVKSGITIGDPSDAGFYALWPAPTAMSANPATISVPVRYKAADGTVVQGATAIQQLAYAIKGDTGNAGAPGTQAATAYLYQWSTATPANPNGNSTFDWTSGQNTNYTGGNGWTVAIPANPGTPGIKLWQAAKQVTDVATALSTTVSWASGFSVVDISQNGATGSSGTQSAKPVVYQWAATIPSGPTGTSTYTWSSGTFSPTPSGWTLTPGTSPSGGYTLWAAQVNLLDSATASTTTINWTTASISAVGYAGLQGGSARVCYARVASNPTPTSGTVTTTGYNSFPTSSQSSSTWGFAATWTSSDPNPSSTNSLYQSDGIYDPASDTTSWSTPYISSLKVGSLSAITVNTGDLSVTGTIQSNSAVISGSSMTGSGIALYSDGRFAMGNSSRNLSFNGSKLTMNGDMVVTGNLEANAVSRVYTNRMSGTGTALASAAGWVSTYLPNIVVAEAGRLVVQVTAIFHNFSTSSNFRVQCINFVDGGSMQNNFPILYLNGNAAVTGFFDISPKYLTTGNSSSLTSFEDIAVTAGQSVPVEIYAAAHAANTTVYLIDAYYVAVLYKR